MFHQALLPDYAGYTCHQHYLGGWIASRDQHHGEGGIPSVSQVRGSSKCKASPNPMKTWRYVFPPSTTLFTWFYSNTACVTVAKRCLLGVSSSPHPLPTASHIAHHLHIQTAVRINKHLSRRTHLSHKPLTRIALWQWMNFWVKGRK